MSGLGRLLSFLGICKHKWELWREIQVYSDYGYGKRSENPTSHIFVQKCKCCGKLRKVET